MSAPARMLVIIGSGELGPQMTRVHRSVIRRLAGDHGQASSLTATIIDTPYGFQLNADALSAAAVDYFGRRLGMSTSVAAYRRSDDDVLDRETAFARIREADFVFSGPGSPSYALRHWSGTQIPQLLADKLIHGGALVLASAAALTLGRLTVPVYEIYKSGEDPFWLPGLDVLSAIGLHAAVIPHFDNAEGSGHDTRFGFLGQSRLEALEAQMPDDAFILGVDEHTALIIDLDQQHVSVHGRGGVTVRRHGRGSVLAAGEVLTLSDLRRLAESEVAPPEPSSATPEPDQRLDQSEVRTLVRGLMMLEDLALARSAIVQLGEMAERALNDRHLLVEPLIDALLDVRRNARSVGDWATADSIRDRLVALGVEVTDGPDGTTDYRLRSPT